MAAVGSDDRFQPDLLLTCLEDMLPFIEPDDVGTLTHLAVEKKLIPSEVVSELEAMHDSVTPRQKFRYLVWIMYSKKCSVDIFLSLLATLPSGKTLARDYKTTANKITKFVMKKSSTYDWLIKRFSDRKLKKKELLYNITSIFPFNEKDDSFLFLLEGCAGPIEANVRLYDWYKNDVSLNKHSPFLCIEIADIKVEGKYTLRRNQHLMASVTIILKTFMDSFRQDLTKRYLETVTNVDEDEWPKVKQSTYINLAVIKSDKYDNLSSYVRQTIRGDADDVHGEKGETDYKSAFKNIQHGERVIVQGRPGSGKTTLVHKISQDWADQSIEWGHVKALFLIHLRGFRSRPSINLRDFLECYFTGEETVKSIGDYIISKDGLGICFILDGLDEYQPDDKTAFVFKLIEKKVLSKAIVIVASRPAAVAKYRSKGKNIEVLGFFKKQISDYIDSYEFRSASSVSMLKEYLTNRPNIHHMCYLPIQLAMICFLYDLFEEDGDEFPDTETDVYEQFTRHMLLRSFYRQDLEVYLKSIFSLPEEKEMLFRSICNLAFGKTLSSKQVLEQSEVDLFCEKMNTNSSLGLLTVDRKATKCGFQNMYTFCHLTFQEFLAACHVFLSSEVKQLALIEMCKEKQHMTVVLKFFCGLADFESDNAAMFKSITNSPHLNSLAKIQCAYESKQPITCQHVAENNTLNIIENFLTPRDWSSIGFIVLNSSSTSNPVKSLHVNFTGISVEGTESFAKVLKLNKDPLKIEKLQLSGSCDYLPPLFLISLHFIKILSIPMNIKMEYWIKFFMEHDHPNLRVIHTCQDSIPKLAVKLHFSVVFEVLSSFSECVMSENVSHDILCIPEKIFKENFKCESRFFNEQLKSLLSKVCNSNECINLSCTEVKDADNIIVTIESGDRIIIRDIENMSKIFSDNCYGNILTPNDIVHSLDLISYADQIVLVFKQTSLTGNKFEIYILSKAFVVQEFIYNKQMAYLFVKSIPQGMKLQAPAETHQLNVRMKRICITNDVNFNKINRIELFSQSIDKVHVTSAMCSSCKIAESLIAGMELKFFSLRTMISSNFVAGKSSIINDNLKIIVSALAYKDLHVLDMSHCNLSAIIDSSLVPALKVWKSLTELYLKSCSITGKDMSSLLEGIEASSDLNTLDLSNNEIGDEGCQALAVPHASITNKHSIFHLQNLNLSCCHICDSGIMALAGSIQENFDIELLDLSGNSCQSRVIRVLFSALQSCKNLSVLNLSRLSIGDFSVFSTLNSNSVRALNLCACEADLSSLNSLAECPSLLSSLCVLDMSENNWPTTELIRVLRHTCNLQEITLSNLSLLSTDSIEFIKVFKGLRNLKVLRLNHAKVEPDFNDFASLIKSETLRVVEITHLICKSSEYFNLCENIKYATHLHSLDLSHINFHEYLGFKNAGMNKAAIEPSPYNNAAIALSKTIKYCTKLLELKLVGCGIKQTGAIALTNSIQECISLKFVDLSYNCIYFRDELQSLEQLTEFIL